MVNTAVDTALERAEGVARDNYTKERSKRAHTPRKCEECCAVFIPRRSNARFCIEHRRGAAAIRRYRATLIHAPCAMCGERAEQVADDISYCAPCNQSRKRTALWVERRRTAIAEQPPGNLGLMSPLELERYATVLLFESDDSSATEHPVVGVDANAGDVLDQKWLPLPKWEDSRED